MPEAKQGDQTPQPKAPSPTVAAVESAPDSPDRGGKVVRTMSPTHRFVVEGLPVVTRDGTRVSADDFKKLQEAADKQVPKVRIVEVND